MNVKHRVFQTMDVKENTLVRRNDTRYYQWECSREQVKSTKMFITFLRLTLPLCLCIHCSLFPQKNSCSPSLHQRASLGGLPHSAYWQDSLRWDFFMQPDPSIILNELRLHGWDWERTLARTLSKSFFIHSFAYYFMQLSKTY